MSFPDPTADEHRILKYAGRQGIRVLASPGVEPQCAHDDAKDKRQDRHNEREQEAEAPDVACSRLAHTCHLTFERSKVGRYELIGAIDPRMAKPMRGLAVLVVWPSDDTRRGREECLPRYSVRGVLLSVLDVGRYVGSRAVGDV